MVYTGLYSTALYLFALGYTYRYDSLMASESNSTVSAGNEFQKYQTYEEYLDERVTEEDMFYLDDPELARRIVELSSKGNYVLSRTEFEYKRKEANKDLLPEINNKYNICSQGLVFEPNTLLYALAKREEMIRQGKLSTIIFLRDIVAGHEISGYIDYSYRLNTEDFTNYFIQSDTNAKKFTPKKCDLSYYNWTTNVLHYNNSPTFQVVIDNSKGLLFKHRKDKMIINPDTKASDNHSHKTILKTDQYLQVIIFDYATRRKV